MQDGAGSASRTASEVRKGIVICRVVGRKIIHHRGHGGNLLSPRLSFRHGAAVRNLLSGSVPGSGDSRFLRFALGMTNEVCPLWFSLSSVCYSVFLCHRFLLKRPEVLPATTMPECIPRCSKRLPAPTRGTWLLTGTIL